MKTKSIKMKLGKETYSIAIGTHLSAKLVKDIPEKTSSIILISDQRLNSQRKEIRKALKTLSIPVSEIPVTAGEGLKKIASVYSIFGKMIKAKADRNSLVIALGGGTVGDVAGFIASTFMRGIPWIGIPTTLLGQVDSSVGGKTAINHELGKNLIGSFHQPILVLCDVSFLKTLSQREIVSGLGEIIKYSFTYDKKFFKWLEKNLSSLLKGHPEKMMEAIEYSLKLKCNAVASDVEDRSGKREILNFGHTFGHALESATHYKKYQHGEAVILGMRFALALSQIRHHLSEKNRQKMEDLLLKLSVPSIPRTLKKSDIFKHMKRDKKLSKGRIRFVLLSDIGQVVSDSSVTQKDLDEAFYALTGRED